jgi:hypothetical protein
VPLAVGDSIDVGAHVLEGDPPEPLPPAGALPPAIPLPPAVPLRPEAALPSVPETAELPAPAGGLDMLAAPAIARGNSQNRGNSGILLMGIYEIQVLDNFNNPTYADGTAGAIYGQWPPLVNALRAPGVWQAYDIVFEAPHFTGRVTPGYFTILWNGVIVHNRAELFGSTLPTMTPHVYTPHDAELPLQLQGRAPVRYRNVWIRRLKPYDQGAKVN